MRATIPSLRLHSFSSILEHIKGTRTQLTIPFKYRHTPKFRDIVNSRTMIINMILPDMYKLPGYLLFTSVYFDEELRIKSKDALAAVHIDQERILQIGKDLLDLRLYNALLFQNPKTKAINQIDRVNPWKYNTFASRTAFLNQFHGMLDSKNKLNKMPVTASTTRTIKVQEDVRHKVIPMLIGLIYCQYGFDGSKDFTDEWIIRGSWSTKYKFTHKGLLEIHSDKSDDF